MGLAGDAKRKPTGAEGRERREAEAHGRRSAVNKEKTRRRRTPL